MCSLCEVQLQGLALGYWFVKVSTFLCFEHENSGGSNGEETYFFRGIVSYSWRGGRLSLGIQYKVKYNLYYCISSGIDISVTGLFICNLSSSVEKSHVLYPG